MRYLQQAADRERRIEEKVGCPFGLDRISDGKEAVSGAKKNPRRLVIGDGDFLDVVTGVF